MKLSIEQVQKLADAQKSYNELYETIGFCAIRENGVHMVDMDFIETFETFAVTDDGGEDYPFELSAVVDSVQFFTILNAEELAELETTHPDKFEYISKALQHEPS
ncbi:hypothetical protein H9649_07625 [Sporosarcina sp. Sa2YVA2]|uniref:Uncharacterized protein n=1 Tax=Sporosarcina quadrami TaxID=2762234 RepID=A0ABR8U8T3_9BACL|nr:hypothetical protein [Sporosarcina quadrami]MBD7984444.1 hypothetical protein [Sporosarcina quadrami]